jgi:hypothetical protein
MEIERTSVFDIAGVASTSGKDDAAVYSGRARDTGMLLAEAGDNEDYELERRRAIEKFFPEKEKRRLLGEYNGCLPYSEILTCKPIIHGPCTAWQGAT